MLPSIDLLVGGRRGSIGCDGVGFEKKKKKRGGGGREGGSGVKERGGLG